MNIQYSLMNEMNFPRAWAVIEKVAREQMGFPTEALAHFKKRSSDMVKTNSRGSESLRSVATVENILAGALIGAEPEGGVGNIIWLVVASECRKMGIGRILFEKACEVYSSLGCHKVKLTAPTEEAARFYEKVGMKCEGKHEDHWWHMDFWTFGKAI